MTSEGSTRISSPMSISCVTVSFILEANNAACSSNLGMVVSLFFIGAIFDFPRIRLQCFELVFITVMYATAPYALQEASANICNSTFFVSVDLKLIQLGTANDDNFKTEFAHKEIFVHFLDQKFCLYNDW